MEKQFLKRKLPNVVIIEGFWNIGKTSVLNYIAKLNGFEKIEEPDHTKSNIKKNISVWYKKQHQKRMKMALNSLKQGKKVIMERSIISSIAYKYANSQELLQEDFQILKEIDSTMNGMSIIFFMGTKHLFIDN